MMAKHYVLFLIIAFAACKSKVEKEVLRVDVSPQDTVQLAESAPLSEPVIKLIDEGVNQDDKYFLIVDSYTVEEFAEAWNKIYQERGFKSDLVMKNEDGYYRVALKSFNLLDQAKKALEEIQEDEEFSQVWIMVK